MKCSESWLREWVNPDLTREKLSSTLTMAGLEVESITSVADDFSGVIIGQIIKVDPHPDSDRLHLCEVNIEPTHSSRHTTHPSLQIVCGAENARPGLNVAVAMINAILPNHTTITPTTLRGVLSQGMLCSASELGLAEESSGLLELPPDAPLGQSLKSYMMLDDYVIDISITPNRGDCLSIKGIARELSALTGSPLLTKGAVPIVKPTIHDVHSVSVQSTAGCPRYVGRIIRQVKADAVTPTWMKERLRRAGVRSINVIVDVTNYVMLELGQPMHAFDLNTIDRQIIVRMSQPSETIALLDGSQKQLDAETLVIADNEKPLAIAGVMGGLDSGVTLLTKNIFLESAFFVPTIVARQRQYYGLNSESAYRFERGVDSAIQRDAIERATQLILDLSGGEPGPVIEVVDPTGLPKENVIVLAPEKIAAVLGVSIPDDHVEAIFKALAFSYRRENHAWVVTAPSYRFDLTLPEDVIEEIARLYGYNHIPVHELKGSLQAAHASESAREGQPLRQALSHLGYHEIISYSFVDKKLQNLIAPAEQACELVNPMSADMAVMRTHLWPGLINALLYNRSRQQHRIRLFEIGTCFTRSDNVLLQQPRLGGLIMGLACPEQWGQPARDADFYDIKGDIENILQFALDGKQTLFKPDTHPALHPGQTAGIYCQEQKLGVLGALHPQVLQTLGIAGKVFVFDLNMDQLYSNGLHRFNEISKFPEIRRDIAILVNQAIPAREIQDTIRVIAGDWLKDVFIFDVYEGKGISPGLKSIALALIIQHPTRTLVDDEVAALIERVMTALKGTLGAELRG